MEKNNGFNIKQITGREILDSRGNPTVEVDVRLAGGALGRACVPSGASTGTREALEMRDGDKKRYGGKGVRKAVENVNAAAFREIHDFDARDQKALDGALIKSDDTPNKARLGANAILGVSLAAARASAAALGVPLHKRFGDGALLPAPMMNVLNGGAHAANNLDIQEFMLIPYGAPNFAEALRWGAECYHALKSILRGRGLATGVGDEGGFAPDLKANEEAFDLLSSAVEKAGFRLGADVGLALDAAASAFCENGKYRFKGEKKEFTSDALIDYYESLVDRYPIVSLEDPLAEGDWAGWAALTERLGKRAQIVGDDIFVTQAEYLRRGVKERSANAILIKLNQVGTVTETLDVVAEAQKASFGIVVSHRSGETEDSSIAHLAVGTSAGQIKTGAPCRTDRTAKYNELMRIEENLGSAARYAGREPYKRYLKTA